MILTHMLVIEEKADTFTGDFEVNIMQKSYVSISEFNQFKTFKALPALRMLGINPEYTNKLNDFAALMLGYANYEALQPLHSRENAIRNHLYNEVCVFQRNQWTIKASNILIVFDEVSQVIRLRALMPGEETELVTSSNQSASASLSDFGEGIFDGLYFISNEVESRLSAMIRNTNDDSFYFHVDIVRTDEGVNLKIYKNHYDEQSNTEVFSEVGVMFSDVENLFDQNVDQVSVKYRKELPSIDGVYYQWLKPVIEDGEERYLYIEDIGDGPNLSELMFKSYKEAAHAVELEIWGYGTEDVEDCVIVKVTKRLEGNPFQ